MRETLEFIVEKVAPIFNKKGYTATSLSEITKATQLTKGAIYFYFKNKEDLAVKAFHYNIEKIIMPLRRSLLAKENSIDKLLAITGYFREDYYKNTREIGGCPMLNLGVDAQFNNKVLFDEAQKLSKKLISTISGIIESGINKQEISKEVDSKKISMMVYAMIEGGIFMSITHDNHNFLIHLCNHIEETIIRPIRV
ncbi:TetR/AcrR family transcriptional regulator [Chryseobacterium sp.]|uniref:TetR/AcrR family transcriptional regulator n=1 Tax=Chryseobacterium sp. TaxID=1871047 RepID=UPI0025BEB93D|nr:TetR/AcrR family transcriptional regulator [Chryseobacterium sp.]MBV8325958.1 TetR/AcrR family transcriptional regulator [Chryseobacterium sp.]